MAVGESGGRAKVILSINAGSSSVKISVYNIPPSGIPHELAVAQLDGLTAPPAKLKYVRGVETVCRGKVLEEEIKDQDAACKYLVDELVDDKELKEITKREDVTHICHRIVHGGSFSRPQIVTNETYHVLEALTELAPLHNSPALAIIRSCIKVLPHVRNIAYFDSQFHQSIPEHIRTYPINLEIAKKNELRKYGFHGISYAFITRSAAEFLGRAEDETNIIALHLGSGASACAIKNGKSWDTSMGLTPLAGLPGATRSGSVDPSLVFHYASDVGKLSPASTKELHISRAEEILNKESGWKSLTGTTDFAKICAGYDSNPSMRLAFDLFVDRICGFIGTYYVSLRGQVDALVFAGGIGEKSAELRRRVVEQCECLGFAISDELNGKGVEESKVVWDVSAEGVRHKVLVCKTDEQFEMARGVAADAGLFAFGFDDDLIL